MPDPAHPSPRRKARAGLVVVAIVLVVAVIVFFGFSAQYATEVDENAPPSPIQQ